MIIIPIILAYQDAPTTSFLTMGNIVLITLLAVLLVIQEVGQDYFREHMQWLHGIIQGVIIVLFIQFLLLIWQQIATFA